MPIGCRPERCAPCDLAELTEREVEVLKLVAGGLSNREIADRLVLAEATVKTHVSHVLDKLGLRDGRRRSSSPTRLGLVRPGSIDGEGSPASSGGDTRHPSG